MANQTLEKTFAVSGAAELNLGTIRGLVNIHPGADGVITVKAEKLAETGDVENTVIEIEQVSDNSVKVKTRYTNYWMGWLFGSKPCKVIYTVTAPRSCALNINGVSADMTVEGFEGDSSFKTVSGDLSARALNGSLYFDSVSGDLQLADLVGDLRFNTVSGDINGRRLAGALRLNTVSGDIDFEESNLPSVNASTVSGEVAMETGLGEGPYAFKSVSGGLTLKVPADTRLTAELQTISGDLTVKLPVTSMTHRGGRRSVDAQGGGVNVSLNSVSGDMRIKS